ncbi:MAG: heavy metal-responsive transcriptional regulator [Gemmatimonadota bacterium]|nr:heavy metal-responsive transcriptional regulator [Gemmatimonadota bacterium]
MGNPERGDKREFRIGELGRRVGINPKTVRYYEEVGLLPQPARSESGYRVYTEEDIDRLTFIRAAREFGFGLGEIREIMAVRERGEVPCPYVLLLVRDKLADLQDRILRLQLLGRDLEAFVHEAQELPSDLVAQKGRYCHVIENRLLGDGGLPGPDAPP